MKVRALVLAAGYGTRLAPLTHTLPKPLIPVRGVSVLERTLRSLAAIGCESAVVNLHHLGGQIRSTIGASCAGMEIRYSYEDQILGTLGGLLKQWHSLRESDLVVVVNGDSLCDWPWLELIESHRRTATGCTLLVHRSLDPTPYGGGIGLEPKGLISRLRGLPTAARPTTYRLFLGAQVLSSAIFTRLDRLATGPVEARDLVADLYQPMLFEGRPLNTMSTRCEWHDLGTPQRYLTALRSTQPKPLPSGSWISPHADLAASAAVTDSTVEAGATLATGSRIERALIMPGAKVGRSSFVSESILGPDLELPPGSSVRRRMVTKAGRDYRLAADESLVGNLVMTPL